MKRKRVKLEKEKETLLIPLYSKAIESKKEESIISDNSTVELVNKIDYDFDKLKIPKKTHITICIRAKQFDNYTRYFIKNYPNSTVIHLGCGLDSRFLRVDNGKVEWYDLDYPEVIELRKNFYEETDRYHMISSSVVDFEWIDELGDVKEPYLVLAEGLFMYLKEEDVKSLILKLQEEFTGCTLIFDTYSIFTAKHIKHHPSIRKTGADIYWGIDDPREIEELNVGIRLIDEWDFTQSEEIKKLNLRYRFLFKMARLFSIARKAHRIFVFELK